MVFEILEGRANRVEALSLKNGGLLVPVVILDKDKAIVAGVMVVLEIEGFGEMRSRNGVNGVTELVVQIPNLLENSFNLLNLHFKFHVLDGLGLVLPGEIEGVGFRGLRSGGKMSTSSCLR